MLEIKKMNPPLMNDYLQYFDNVAFCDHKEWSDCYCVYFNKLPGEEEKCAEGCSLAQSNRRLAISLINDGRIKGYLAYSGGNVIGWCNANDKTAYSRITAQKELCDGLEAGDKVKSVVCFSIAPKMRGKGIASKLLECACSDAAADGYDYLESYPQKFTDDVYLNYRGPYSLYKKYGFVLHKELSDNFIMRKYISK